MCGIVGSMARGVAVDRSALESATRLLAHRGPDDLGVEVLSKGRVGLGFTRLAIQDLSPAGAQPMANEDGSLYLVCNGEIYNHASLRRGLEERGHVFRSRTDVEVILHLYEERGPDLLDELDGMFAFAIWDEPRRRLMLARDQLGIKPLYYRRDGSGLTFASELRCILTWPGKPPKVNRAALSDYLTYGYVPHDRCIVDGVSKLPAGHMLVAALDGDDHAGPIPYWDVEPRDDQCDPRESVEELRRLMGAAVSRQMVADVPVGIFLSGGLDSSAVLSQAAGETSTPIKSYCLSFDAGDSAELPFARAAAERFGASLRTKVLARADAERTLEAIAETYDEPLLDYSTIPTLSVSALAAEDVKVVLSGDGGDEVFGGYGRYLEARDVETRRRGAPRRARAESFALSGALPFASRVPGAARLAALERSASPDPVIAYSRRIGLFDHREIGRLQVDGGLDSDPLWLFRKFHRSDISTLTALRYLDLKTYLVDNILVKVDRASMAHSLEVRPPLLDRATVEFAFSLDDESIAGDGRGKRILRDAIAPTVPSEILARSKRGFGSPVRAWLREDLAAEMVADIDNWTIVRAGLIDGAYVRTFMRLGSFNRWAKLWSLIVLEAWHRRWIWGRDDA